MNEIIQITSGLLCGYLITTICESFYHRFGWHAPKRVRDLCKYSGQIGNIINDRWFSHWVIHHRATYRYSYVNQFSSPQEKETITNKLLNAKKAHVVEQDYGLRVGNFIEHIYYALPTAPFIVIACWAGGLLFSLGAITPLIIMPLMSEYIHPLLHLAKDDALNKSNFFLRIIIRTKYFKYISRHHWLHHKYNNCNYNLMPGGDLILRCNRSPSELDLKEMSKQGIDIKC